MATTENSRHGGYLNEFVRKLILLFSMIIVINDAIEY